MVSVFLYFFVMGQELAGVEVMRQPAVGLGLVGRRAYSLRGEWVMLSCLNGNWGRGGVGVVGC